MATLRNTLQRGLRDACDASDATQVQTWINGATYDVRGDVDLDGDVDADDKALIEGDYSGLGAGRGVLSNVSSRKGYAGYEFDRYIGQKYHVRHRVLDANLGRWLRRDPIPFGVGHPLYEYVRSQPHAFVDPSGLDIDWCRDNPAIRPWIVCLTECLYACSDTFRGLYDSLAASSVTVTLCAHSGNPLGHTDPETSWLTYTGDSSITVDATFNNVAYTLPHELEHAEQYAGRAGDLVGSDIFKRRKDEREADATGSAVLDECRRHTGKLHPCIDQCPPPKLR